MRLSGFLTLCALLFVQPFFAEEASPDQPSAVPSAAGQSQPASDPASSAHVSEGPLSRWLDLNTLSFSMRYRNVANMDGFHLFDFGQQRSLVDGALKLDSEGKYEVHFHVSSGRYFNWAYADVIGGTYADKVYPAIYRYSPEHLQKLCSGCIEPRRS